MHENTMKQIDENWFGLQKEAVVLFFLITGLWILDLIAKWLAKNNFIAIYENKGIAFGLFQTSPGFVLIISTIVWLVVLLFMFEDKLEYWPAYMLILLGGSSNLFDRFIYGHVIDYLNFGLFQNNIADIMIVLGFSYYVFMKLKTEKYIN